MKNELRHLAILFLILHSSISNCQDFKFDFEPYRPFEMKLNAPLLPLESKFINGRFVLVEEPKEEYRRRDIEYKKQQHENYLNSTEYKEWEKKHNEWKARNPDWRDKTRDKDISNGSHENSDSPKLDNQIVTTKNYIVNSPSLNIRSGPNKSFPAVETLKLGDIVKLLNDSDGVWWLIEYGSTRGYVASQYLKIDELSGWEKTSYNSGETPSCENVTPEYDYDLDNYLKINVGSNTDVVVKLMKINYSGDECIRIVYVRSNDVYLIKNIPEGKYYLKIAYGKDYRQKKIDNQCYVRFVKSAQYEKGTEILDFNKIRKPNETIRNKIYENWDIPSFELSLDIVTTNKSMKNTFDSKDISEEDFNR